MLSIATGYNPDYLLKEVATGRENYYTGAVAEGEPPGRWWGAGAASLGLTGEVDAQDMTAVYSRHLDPRAEGFRDPARWDEVATLGHAGRAYKPAEQWYAEALEREPGANAERRDELRVQAGKDAHQNVAFLDATFSVQKSVTMLHTAFEAEEVRARAAGLDDDAAQWAGLREKVETAIWAGNDAALSYLQDQAGYARVGHHGGEAGRWIDAHEWTVASFFQHDSRDHDPQLHIHNAIHNRQRGADGAWRTLDSRAIHRIKPAAAAVGERTCDERLMRDLGIGMAMRPGGAAREVSVVTPETREMFSSRAQKISGRAAVLLDEFEASRGREATGLERDRIKRAATLSTRASKSHQGETRAQVLDRIDAQLRSEVAGGLADIAHNARAEVDAARAAGEEGAAVERWSVSQVLEDALHAAQAKKPSFTHADVVRELNAVLPDRLGLPEGADVAEVLHRLADRAVALVEQVDKAGPGDDVIPTALRKNDGTSAYQAPGGPSYVTREHLRGENRLRASTEARDGAALSPSQAKAFVTRLRDEGIELGVDQAAALTGILTSGARLETLIGPAGTGKSFVVGSLVRAWTDPAHRGPTGPDGRGAPEGRVFGLATAQVAANVLEAEGVTATNTARWLATQRRLDSAAAAGRPAFTEDAGWRLRAGDVLVVDESSMADTADLTAIHAYADEAGAKMLLVGDPRQLGAVGAGGAMDLVAEAGARYELADARRFTHQWEREASLRLRDGDPDVVAEYHRQGRLLDAGAAQDAEASAASAWLADTLAGRRSLLVVDTNEQAARVSGSIRDELVRLGRVGEAGVALRDGTFAGVGDVVQGRRLAWELAGYDGNRRGAVNREHYRVTGVRDDGALEVTVVPAGAPFLVHDDDRGGEPVVSAAAAGERLVLPPEYVTADLTLGYASTVHAAEGATVDTSHAVVADRTSLNALYTALSRGREANTAHTATVTGADDLAQGGPEQQTHRDPRAVLAGILDTREATDQAQRSATAAAEDSAARAASLPTAADRFADAAHQAATTRTARWLDHLAAADVLGPVDRVRIAAEDGTGDLARLLRQAEIAGHDPAEVLRGAVADRPLDGARRVTDVVCGRIRAEHTFEPLGTRWAGWLPADVDSDTHHYLATLAEAADTRTHELGAQAATSPPSWATAALGPVPDEQAAREVWQARAGAIAAHRELQGTTTDPAADVAEAYGATDARPGGFPDAVGVVGSAPPRQHVEAHAAYRAAYRASGLPDHDRDVLERSHAWHRAVVRAAEREDAWGPAYVDNHLAGTRQAESHHRRQAEVRRAEAAVSSDEHERERLTREAGHSEATADVLAGQVERLEHDSDTRAQWLADTAVGRAMADTSLRFLAANPDHDADPAVTAHEWLELDRAARRDDDPHRTITDTDLDQRPHDQAHIADSRLQDDRVDTQRAEDEPARQDRAAAEDPPLAETDVPDVRDVAAETPRAVDEDTVHTPDPDESAEIDALARRAQVEMRNRAALDAQHEADERAAQLAHWHAEDTAGREPDESTDRTVADAPAYDVDVDAAE